MAISPRNHATMNTMSNMPKTISPTNAAKPPTIIAATRKIDADTITKRIINALKGNWKNVT